MRYQSVRMGRKHLETLVYPHRLWMLISKNIFQSQLFLYKQIALNIFIFYYVCRILSLTKTKALKSYIVNYQQRSQSNLVHSTLLYPYSKYQLIQSRYEQKNNIIRNNNSSTMGIASQYDPNPNPSMMLEKRLSRQIIPKFQMSSSTLISEDPYRHRRSKSNLSSYGSNSLSNLTKVSDKLVYENQQKDFNIVSLIPKQYNQSIKMYPKLRNQRKQDHPNKIRQAFIAGKSQQGLAQSKIFLSNQSNESKRKNSQTSRRLNPEYRE